MKSNLISNSIGLLIAFIFSFNFIAAQENIETLGKAKDTEFLQFWDNFKAFVISKNEAKLKQMINEPFFQYDEWAENGILYKKTIEEAITKLIAQQDKFVNYKDLEMKNLSPDDVKRYFKNNIFDVEETETNPQKLEQKKQKYIEQMIATKPFSITTYSGIDKDMRFVIYIGKIKGNYKVIAIKQEFKAQENEGDDDD
jgi:predicted double-glycine peptidase